MGIVSTSAVRTVGHALTWLLPHSRDGQQANQQERGVLRVRNRSCSFVFVCIRVCVHSDVSLLVLTAHFTASTPLVSRFADSDLDLRAPAHHTSQVAAAAAPSLDSTRTWERSTKSYEYGIWCQQRTARPLSIADTWSAVHNAGSVLSASTADADDADDTHNSRHSATNGVALTQMPARAASARDWRRSQ